MYKRDEQRYIICAEVKTGINPDPETNPPSVPGEVVVKPSTRHAPLPRGRIRRGSGRSSVCRRRIKKTR